MGIRITSALVSVLSPRVWNLLAGMLAGFFWIVCTKYRKRTLKNLVSTGRTLEEAGALGKASFRSNLLVFFESLSISRFLKMKGVRVETRLSPEAEEELKKIRSGKRKITIAASAHTGFWELAAVRFAALAAPTPLVVSARMSENPVISRILKHARRNFGFDPIDRKHFLRTVIKRERSNSPNVYAMLCDLHFKAGIKVPLMGRPACTLAMPAILARKYNAPVFLGRCVRKAPGDYRVDFDLLDQAPFKDLPEDEALYGITAAISRYIEESVSIAPEQWIWAYRHWRGCCTREA